MRGQRKQAGGALTRSPPHQRQGGTTTPGRCPHAPLSPPALERRRLRRGAHPPPPPKRATPPSAGDQAAGVAPRRFRLHLSGLE